MAGRLIVETQRLWLRELVEEDVDAYYALGSDPLVIRYTGAERLTSLNHALQVLRERPLADYQRYGYGRWACVLKSDREFIGWCGLKYLEDFREVDLGYWFLPAYWGRGLATEAACACVQYGFEHLQLLSIMALVDPENVRSARVLEKVGMRRLGSVASRHTPCVKYEIRLETHHER